MSAGRVVVIGAGIGGLVAAVELAAQGVAVTVLERAGAAGGKLRLVQAGGVAIDAGPTVFTMRPVFEAVFASAGANLADRLTLRRAEVLARHAWNERDRLDLFAEIDRSADAIGAFAGAAEARGYRAFTARAARIFETLDAPFMRAAEPSLLSLVRGAAMGDLMGISPFTTLWRELGTHFRDERLRQLFGRYATYTGSSPFLAPATLMLVAHAEQSGVWLVDGGMHALARALADLAAELGVAFRYGAEVAEITVAGGRATGVVLAGGEAVTAEAVIVNADVAAVARGRFGPAVASAVPAMSESARSLSALTLALHAQTDGFPLARHTVFFSRDYAAEFDDILRHRRLPAEPTVYVCAQDRDDGGDGVPSGALERLFCIVNAPPDGDRRPPSPQEIAQCTEKTYSTLRRCGLTVSPRPDATVTTGPAEFACLFPATGGALYGRAGHGWRAAFQRPAPRTALPGLYVAGGSAHPGPGIPMAALSGRLAAASLLADRDSTSRSRATVTRGGISMR